MAIILNDNLSIGVGAPIDNKYLSSTNAPYSNISEVLTNIPISQRYQGLTVNISSIEYWFKDGVSDSDLILKGAGGSGSGERIEKTFIQTSHGFSLGDVVAYSGGSFILAIASEVTNSETIGFVSFVENINEFTVTFSGYVNGLSSLNLTPNTTYNLDPNDNGKLTSDDIDTFEKISKPILVTLTADEGIVLQYRGFIVSSGLTNGGEINNIVSGITKIQNIGTGTGQVFSNSLLGVSGITSSLRTLVGSGGTNIVTNGNNIIISSDSSGNYNLASPSNITVGGISSGTVLTGKSTIELLESMLVTTYFPTYVAPSNTFTLINQPATQEVGITVPTLSFTSTFNRGSILLQGVTQSSRSGFPNTYNYSNNNNVSSGITSTVSSTSFNNGQVLNDVDILLGANTWSSSVSYDVGVQPLDSNGNNFDTPLPAGTTSFKSVTINGIYPWFYGKVSSAGAITGANRPIANSDLIATGQKVVATSINTISVQDFDSTSDDYIWFAIPAPTVKSVWYVTGVNNGTFGGANDLFPNATTVNITSPNNFWENISYNIYISNVQTAATYMEFREN